jgi:hypothetical protein
MAIATAAVTVATTATLLATGGGGAVDAAYDRKTTVTVKPATAGTGDSVFVGGSGVTAASGIPLGGGISFDLDAGEALYGIVASGTVAVRVLEHGI